MYTAYPDKNGNANFKLNGFKDAKIVASNDLDEYQIEKLKKDQAPIDI